MPEKTDNNSPFQKPSHRLDKVNSNIKQIFGEIIQKEADLPPDTMVTISAVETSKNLQTSTVWLLVLPFDKSQKTLRKLQPQMYHLQGIFNRELKIKPLPRLILKIDHGAEHADNIERKIAELHQEQ